MESEKDKMEHDKSIALITQDINYIKKDLVKMGAKLDATDSKLDAVLNHYIQREEFTAKMDSYQNQLDKRVEGLHERFKEKLDIKDFEPYKTGLTKILWIVLSTVVAGLLGLLYVR